MRLPDPKEGPNAADGSKKALQDSDDETKLAYVLKRLPVTGTPILKAADARMQSFNRQFEAEQSLQQVVRTMSQYPFDEFDFRD